VSLIAYQHDDGRSTAGTKFIAIGLAEVKAAFNGEMDKIIATVEFQKGQFFQDIFFALLAPPDPEIFLQHRTPNDFTARATLVIAKEHRSRTS